MLAARVARSEKWLCQLLAMKYIFVTDINIYIPQRLILTKGLVIKD